MEEVIEEKTLCGSTSDELIMPYSRKPNFPSCDTRCPDGYPCYGWRQIHKGGYVRWQRQRYYHDDLKLLAGLWVYVTIADWLAIEVEIWLTAPWEGETVIASMQEAETKKPQVIESP